jgi:hypothetical protein
MGTENAASAPALPVPGGLHDWYCWWSWDACMRRADDRRRAPAAAARPAEVQDTAARPG